MKHRALAAFALALICCASPAWAEEADPEKLFAEATALMEAQKYEQALPRLLEAQRRDPGIGTQYNIAVCYEKLGKLGSAWRNYTDVVQLARASGKKQREQSAREKLAALEPRVAAFVIKTPDANEATVKVDGAAVKKEDLAFYPVDPGEHALEASAPSKKPWSKTLQAPAAGQRSEVIVPPLEIAKETRVVTVTKETTNGRRTLGFVVGGVGVAGLVTAGVTGVMLLSAKSTADENCTLDIPGQPDKKRCANEEGADAVRRGETLLPINAVAFGVGIVGVGVGTYLLLTSRQTAIVPVVGPGVGGLSLTRSF
jgi:hypothetical protein